MMCNAITAPADSCSPDADRTGPDAPARLPEWVVHLIALVVRFILERAVAARSPRVRLPSWWHYRPDLPPGSVQQLAASRRGAFGNAIAWMCRRRGIGPGHPNWPELSRAIVAFGGSVKGFRPGLPACGLQWWEQPGIVPGMCCEPAETPAATTMALLLSRQAVAGAPPPASQVVPAVAHHAVLPASWLSHWWPTDHWTLHRYRPADRAARCLQNPTLLPDERGRTAASPAVLIRAIAERARPPASGAAMGRPGGPGAGHAPAAPAPTIS